jgi:hypothetical protein
VRGGTVFRLGFESNRAHYFPFFLAGAWVVPNQRSISSSDHYSAHVLIGSPYPLAAQQHLYLVFVAVVNQRNQPVGQ